MPGTSGLLMIVTVIARIRMIPVTRWQRMIVAGMIVVTGRRRYIDLIVMVMVATCQRNNTADKRQGKMSHLHE